MATFDDTVANPNTQFNLARAHELMIEAVKINGGPIPPMKLLMRVSDVIEREAADYFVSQMRVIGVELQPEYADWMRWMAMVDNRQTQVFDAGWQADYPDEQNLFQLFYSKNIPDRGVNSCCYNNPEFDALYEKAMTTQDASRRQAIYVEMNKILMNDCPAIWSYTWQRYPLHYDWVSNFKWMAFGYGYGQYLTIDDNLRSQRLATAAL